MRRVDRMQYAMVVMLAMLCLAAAPKKDVEKRLETLEEGLERAEVEIEIVRRQTRLIIQQTQLGIQDRFYAKGGLAVVSPRPHTLDFAAQTGLGAFAGIGHYIGRHHVIDLSLDWDLYPSISLRYRFEIHSAIPMLTWGPVIGFKNRAAEVAPLDSFLEAPERLKGSFYLLGVLLGFPMQQGMVTVEFLYMFNSQAFLTTNAGIHFFL